MKLSLIAVLFIAGSFASAETTISVQCLCSYYVDFIERSTLAGGTRTSPTMDEVADCQIVHGKVISGCWAAKMNAQFNCEVEAERFTGTDLLSRPAVAIHNDACYGEIRSN